jgi:hypothetical protein
VSVGLAAAVKSPSFAGYQVNGGGELITWKLRARYTLPKLKCTSASRAIAPYIYLNPSQVGTFVGCVKGKPDYFPFVVLNGHSTNYTSDHFKAGDTVALRLVEGPKGASISITDVTRKITEKKTGAGKKGLGFPGIGDGSWVVNGNELGVPNFGTLSFTDCIRNSQALGAGGSPSAPAVFRYNRVSKQGVLQIKTGGLSANKEAFHTTFKHS